jgi:hypothetical protein
MFKWFRKKEDDKNKADFQPEGETGEIAARAPEGAPKTAGFSAV